MQWAYDTRTGRIIPYEIRMDWERHCWSSGQHIDENPYVVSGYNYRVDALLAREVYHACPTCKQARQGQGHTPCPTCGTLLVCSTTEALSVVALLGCVSLILLGVFLCLWP